MIFRFRKTVAAFYLVITFFAYAESALALRAVDEAVGVFGSQVHSLRLSLSGLVSNLAELVFKKGSGQLDEEEQILKVDRAEARSALPRATPDVYPDTYPVMPDPKISKPTTEEAPVKKTSPPLRGEGEILLKFNEQTSANVVNTLLAKWGYSVLERYGNSGIKLISTIGGLEVAISETLMKHPDIEFAEPNKIVTPAYVPDDKEYPKQWHHKKIHSPLAWDIASSTNAIIAVVDTGIEASHDDLFPGLLPGYDTAENTDGFTDIHGHGTEVAGLIAAWGDNALQVAGVAYDAQMLPIRITSDSSQGKAYLSDIVEAVVYAAEKEARVVNVSYGEVCGSRAAQGAARYLKGKGGILIAASGDEGKKLGYLDSEIFCVGAVDHSDTMPLWSSYGEFIDVVAPGVSLLTTQKGWGTGLVSGTSYAAPIVSGVAALLFGLDMNFTPAEVEAILKESAKDLGEAGPDDVFGYGHIDAGGALLLARELRESGAQITLSSVSASMADNDTKLIYKDTPEFLEEHGGERRDSSAPFIFLTAPQDGATVPNTTFQILVRASDSSGIATIDIYIDGKYYASCHNTPKCSAPVSGRTLSRGKKEIVAEVFDKVGNHTRTSVHVVK